MREGKQVLDSDAELQFATASDPEPRKGRTAPEPAEDHSSSDSSDEGQLTNVLTRLQRSWQDSGTKREKSVTEDKKGPAKRFAYLEKAKEQRNRKGSVADHTSQILKNVDLDADPIKTFMALHLPSNSRTPRRNLEDIAIPVQDPIQTGASHRAQLRDPAVEDGLATLEQSRTITPEESGCFGDLCTMSRSMSKKWRAPWERPTVPSVYRRREKGSTGESRSLCRGCTACYPKSSR